MAVVLDINLLCNKMLDINVVATLLNKHEVSIESMNSIDNRMGDNEKTIEEPQQIATILDTQHIVVIKLKQPVIKDMGVYIKKVEDQYVYTLWMNTEGYPVVDGEGITADNSQFYREIIQAMHELNRKMEKAFEVTGIGVETDMYYDKDIMNVIENSKNVIIWVLGKHIGANDKLED